jgi:hypothetical protein
MRILTTILFTLTMLLPAVAVAEEAPVDGDEVVPLAEGEVAPFDGQLFPTELAIRIGFRIENLQLRLQADVRRAEEICQAHRDHDAELLRLEQERRDFEIEQLRTTVQEQAEEIARPTPWYRSWGFAFGMGIVASVLLVGGSVALMIGLT